MIVSGNPNKIILISPNQLNKENLIKYYGDNFIALPLPSGKAKERKAYLQDLKEQIPLNCKCILCANTDMFKTMCKVKNVSGLDGIPTNTDLGIPAFIVPNYYSILYNPEQKSRLDFIVGNIKDFMNGTYKELGGDIIHHEEYPSIKKEVRDFLSKLLKYPSLTVDIETNIVNYMNLDKEEAKKAGLALHHYSNGIYSIAFAWNKNEGGAFIYVPEYRELLKQFFTLYKGKLIFFNAGFDVTQLIYHLFMAHLEDYNGMLQGLHIMCRNLEDAFLVSYLALNSCGRVELGLKALSHEYSGNYAEDVTDVTQVPIKDLLTYNLKDVLSTWYVYEKYYKKMKEDNQEKIYKELFMPSLKVLLETQLVGLRIYPNKLVSLSNELTNISKGFATLIKKSPYVIKFTEVLKQREVDTYNTTHKRVTKTIEDFKDFEFNPNSDSQMSSLLYEYLKLPVIALTKGGNPSISSDTLIELAGMVKGDKDKEELMKNIVELSKVDKIISAFIPAFNRTPLIKGMKGLYGNFNLGGTISGRLSSSNPNLQQIPSTGSVYAEPVKKIFGAPKGYVFISADQRSLEDRISALTTRDKNKLLVYSDGFDGHCLRSYAYFKEQMPDIKQVPEDTECYKVTLDDGTVKYCTKEELDILKASGIL